MKKYIGDKNFYGMVLKIAIPIMIQMGITNFVGLLDNIMVGQVGTEQMTGVAIVNQLIFVFNICIFGGVSGAGIFGTQYYGSGNSAGLKYVLRFKLYICALIGIAATAILLFYQTPLIRLFLSEGSQTGDLESTLQYAKDYLWIMLWGLIPFAVKECFASTLKETEDTIVPMKASALAVFINLLLNYVLIFGKFGAPALGVAGAAIATVISRYVELAFVVIWPFAKKKAYVKGLLHELSIPKTLVKQIIIKGAPLLLNETMWAAGMALLNQCYSQRGLAVVAAININSTMQNMFNVVFMSLGSSISIVVGKILGTGDMEKAKDTARKMIFFSTASCLFMGGLLALSAKGFTNIYNTTNEVRMLAQRFILCCAFLMPIDAFNNAAYFTIRSGGKTFVTFLFDSVFVWMVNLPFAYLMVRYSEWNIILVFASCQALALLKCIIGYILVKKGIWVHKIVSQEF